MSSFFTPSTYMNTTTLGQNLRVRKDIAGLRSRLNEAQTQLASGYKANTHGGLGSSATVAQELRHRLSRLEGYNTSIATIGMRLETVQKGLNTLQKNTEKLTETVYATYAPGNIEAIEHSRVEARSILHTNISILNMSQGSRYLYSGSDISTRPVIDTESMINGSGGRMGLSDVVALRLQADTGTGSGRLSTAEAAGVVTVTHDGGVFGMRLTDITGPAGSVTVPAVAETAANTSAGTIDTAAVALGERVVLSFEMPDGTASTITMIAGTAPLPASPAKDTYYFDTGSGPSFDSVLGGAITTLVGREMTGASGIAAAGDFFDHGAPRIPDGAPATATGLAISSGTVVDWYQGESAVEQVNGPATDPTLLTPTAGDVYMIDSVGPAAGVWAGREGMLATFNGVGWTYTAPETGSRVIADAATPGAPARMYTFDAGTGAWTDAGQAPTQTSARDSVTAKVDDGMSVSHGVRADEQGIRDNLKAAALLLAADLDTAAPDPYQQVARKVTGLLRTAHSDVISTQAEIGVVQERLVKLNESHKDFKAMINNQVLEVEGVDDFELSARLQEMMTRLESSYKIVARLQDMSLTNYI